MRPRSTKPSLPETVNIQYTSDRCLSPLPQSLANMYTSSTCHHLRYDTTVFLQSTTLPKTRLLKGFLDSKDTGWPSPCVCPLYSTPRWANCSLGTKQSSSLRTLGSASRLSDPHHRGCAAPCSSKRYQCCPGSKCHCLVSTKYCIVNYM